MSRGPEIHVPGSGNPVLEVSGPWKPGFGGLGTLKTWFFGGLGTLKTWFLTSRDPGNMGFDVSGPWKHGF